MEVPLNYGHVFIGGLAEGRFQGHKVLNPLLGDSERYALNKQLGRDVLGLTGGDLEARESWPLTEDRLLFSIVLVAAAHSVSLSFAVMSQGGQEQSLSSLEDVWRLTGDTWARRPSCRSTRCSRRAICADVVLTSFASERLRVSERYPARVLLCGHFGHLFWFEVTREMREVDVERLLLFLDTTPGAGRYAGAVGSPELGAMLWVTFLFDAQELVS